MSLDLTRFPGELDRRTWLGITAAGLAGDRRFIRDCPDIRLSLISGGGPSSRQGRPGSRSPV